MAPGVCDLPSERCYHPISCEERGCVKQRASAARLASTQAPATGEVEWLKGLLANASPLPWAYRPFEHDDWGYIRGPEKDGDIGRYRPIVARAHDSEVPYEDHDKHRAAKTDPYGPNAELIVAAVNALPGLLRALQTPASPFPREEVRAEALEEAANVADAFKARAERMALDLGATDARVAASLSGDTIAAQIRALLQRSGR